jgi:6-phosphogluconolactonase
MENIANYSPLPTMAENIKTFDSTDAIAEQLATVISLLEADKLNDEGIHIALSGGNTPKHIFAYLEKHYGKKLALPNLHFWWGDERCVPPTHDESNYKWANQLWLEPVGVELKNIHRVRGENQPEEEAQRYSDEIKSFVPNRNGVPCFDLILLGLGDDGHTASIFPHQMELLHSINLCEVATHPTTGQKRITFTGVLLNHAARVVFISTGSSKADMIRNVAIETMPQFPASHIKPIHGTLEWWIDKDAAALV